MRRRGDAGTRVRNFLKKVSYDLQKLLNGGSYGLTEMRLNPLFAFFWFFSFAKGTDNLIFAFSLSVEDEIKSSLCFLLVLFFRERKEQKSILN